MQPSPLPNDFGGAAGGSGQLTPSGELTDPSGANLRLGGAFPFPGGQIPGMLYDGRPVPRPSKKGQHKVKEQKTRTLPPDLDVDGPSSNVEYQTALANGRLVFSPQALGFLPSNYWLAVDTSFGDLVTKFFQRKNNANCRFPHKLYNALALVEHTPVMYGLVGVSWVTDRIFKVDKLIFGRLLGIMAIDGGLFHRQGNFPSHGFAELTSEEIAPLRATVDLADVDQDRVRLLYHKGSSFSKGSSEDAVTRCKWITDSEARI
jgi:hypothetical protein